jgi:hypothetical protein
MRGIKLNLPRTASLFIGQVLRRLAPKPKETW